MSQENSIVIYYNPSWIKIIRHKFVGSLAGTALCGAIVLGRHYFLHSSRTGMAMQAVLVVWMLFASVWDYVNELARFRRGLPAFDITRDGIKNYVSIGPSGRIAWDDIERMDTRDGQSQNLIGKQSTFKQRFLFIQLKDERCFKYIPLPMRWLVRYGRNDVWKYIRIPEAHLAISADDIMKQLNGFYIERVRDAA